jgi:hypothetical protein
VFQSFPLLYVLLSWAREEEPRAGRRRADPLGARAGLALALDVYGKSGDVAGRWAEIGAGVAGRSAQPSLLRW